MKTGFKIAAGALAAAGLWAGGSYAAVKAGMAGTFGRTKMLKYSTDRTYAEYEALYPGRYTRKPVQISSGDETLQGYIYSLAEMSGDPKGLIIFSHGVFSGQEYYVSGILNMVDRGYYVLGFDNTGCCESTGKNSKGLPQGPIDLSNVLDYVECNRELSDLPRFLFGHSWGGYSVCAVLNFDYHVDGVVSVSGFTNPVDVTQEMGVSMFGQVVRATRPMILLENKKLFGKLAELSAIDGINRSDVPVLIMHGVGDDYVKYNGSGIINHKDEITNPNVEFMPLDYPLRNGHGDFFMSEEAKVYVDAFQEKLKGPVKEYHVKGYWDLPDEVKAEYYRDVDKNISSQVNIEFFDTVDRFYSSIDVSKREKAEEE